MGGGCVRACVCVRACAFVHACVCVFSLLLWDRLTYASLYNTGSSLYNVGSPLYNTGSSLYNKGSSLYNTGSSLCNIRSSLYNTGLQSAPKDYRPLVRHLETKRRQGELGYCPDRDSDPQPLDPETTVFNRSVDGWYLGLY